MSLYTVAPSPFTRRKAEENLAGSILNLGQSTPNFAVVQDTRVIGDVWIDINRGNRVGEIGFSIARKHWRDGLASEDASRSSSGVLPLIAWRIYPREVTRATNVR